MKKYLREFLDRHQLPDAYLEQSRRWFLPLADELARQRTTLGAEQALLVGISGCQGSGKSTATDFITQTLIHEFGLQCSACSLDDFYLGHNERKLLAQHIHPLLVTRGVPGTHDVQRALASLSCARHRQAFALPIFDKASDDVLAHSHSVKPGLDIFIFEGWCLGATAQDKAALETPVNVLEANEDRDGQWREYVNEQLRGEYATLFNQFDCMIMLQAPSFEVVARWRLEQEEKLAKKIQQLAETDTTSLKLMNEQEITRFIQHYQRLTEHLLAELPSRADHVFELDASRQIIAHCKR